MRNFEFKENEFEAKFSLYVTGKQVMTKIISIITLKGKYYGVVIQN